MSRIQIDQGTVTFKVKDATYYVKQNFAPSIQVFKAEVPYSKRKGIPETFFSNGPVERIVSLLGANRCNVVNVRLASDMDLTQEERDILTEAVGPDFYFSRSAYDYKPSDLPLKDPEIALGYQVVLDTIVRNWDDGERNMAWVEGIPVWYDFGASLDPRCQNVFRFILKLEEARNLGRVSSIVTYFMDYTRRRSQILKRAIATFSTIPNLEIRTILNIAKVEIPAYFGEYVANNIKQVSEDIDIIRGAFLRELVVGREGWIK
ncbi:MAG TPA: hypothetical protein GXX23_01845 [Firmicutes bacterium]|nr:hypothetical protein [Candidatus Fermentithermobacillaceae bacterium]